MTDVLSFTRPVSVVIEIFDVPLAPILYLLALEGKRWLSNYFGENNCFRLFRVILNFWRRFFGEIFFSGEISGEN
ncbi:MAG: hypothetical protein LBF34_05135, partial [Puniceicoccales bacterium]|nr:hypothetical protein [Puniceicoccales bacterium]